ncbi:YycH family regulatory protein [Mesobacillus foraminis]|uniref:YycH family regulatory protein n=1 Tax=Mesobacillus foraminis TaxID=279826 RepID=UPI000EF502BE|nr:two-component system activity regulator YycH [Mesobacillus foraminis]
MTYENIKTAILTILIVLGGVLTWNIWTFQPEYEIIENENTVNEVNIGSKREIKRIVKPHQVIFHTGGKDYGTNNIVVIDRVTAMASKWKYYDVKKSSESSSQLNKRFSQDNQTEIIFPDEVPIDLYKKVLNFEDQNIPKFEFDRIIIDAKTGQREEGSIYFYSSKNREAYISNVSVSAINEFSKEFQDEAASFNAYFPHKMSGGKTVYLPDNQTKMVKYTYYRNNIDPDQLKEALFRDPSFVQKSVVQDGEEYADEASKMTVDNNTNMIDYVNPFRENDAVIGTTNLVQKSIDFVNDHSGWTDNYRYVYKDDFNQKVIFRMYSSEGYPIFNQLGMSEISQTWGPKDISRYERPNFHLELPLNPEMNMVTLPSGEEALEILKQKTDLKPELIKDISPGYYMKKDPDDSSLIFLEPGWFYNYDNEWRELLLDGEVR